MNITSKLVGWYENEVDEWIEDPMGWAEKHKSKAAAVKGLRTMQRSEWDRTYSELMTKCSRVLAEYGGCHED